MDTGMGALVTLTEQSKCKMAISPLQPKQNEISNWLVEQVTILAEAMGQPMTSARLTIYALDLADIDQQALVVAFRRARRECRFFPQIAELREFAGASAKEQKDAEARAAWDELIRFVDRYVQSDVYGRYAPDQGCRLIPMPVLSQRIVDTVRRTGGWRAYKCLTNDDLPFARKRFLEEYAAWSAVEQIATTKLLGDVKQLAIRKAM